MAELKAAGLRATPQRIAILEALRSARNHPSAEQLLREVNRNHPEISPATIYNTLEVFTGKGLVKMVKTDKDSMRYDPVTEPHHHLYCHESDRIEDYFSDDLSRVISDFFRENRIEGFEIDDIKVQIIGKFR